MIDFRVATRRSPLALAQATLVVDLLTAAGHAATIVPVVSAGDRDRTTPVTALSQVGAFVRAVQAAVLDGRADIAVHSGKDLPVEGPEELQPFYPLRAAPWDALCGSDLASLEPGAVVGTGSPRRAAQLRMLRPDVEVRGLRGNVGSRLAKVGKDGVAAVVLAEAGLARLGRSRDVTHRFGLGEMVPAPAQAALTVEAAEDGAAAHALAEIDDPRIRRTVEAERQLLAISGAGCRSALGAYAEEAGDGSITMTAFVSDERGPRRDTAVADSPVDVAKLLAVRLGM